MQNPAEAGSSNTYAAGAMLDPTSVVDGLTKKIGIPGVEHTLQMYRSTGLIADWLNLFTDIRDVIGAAIRKQRSGDPDAVDQFCQVALKSILEGRSYSQYIAEVVERADKTWPNANLNSADFITPANAAAAARLDAITLELRTLLDGNFNFDLEGFVRLDCEARTLVSGAPKNWATEQIFEGKKSFCLRQPSPNQISNTELQPVQMGFRLVPRRPQEIVPSSADPSAVQELLGEKPLKVLQLSQAGFPIPPFFIVLGNCSGELEINEDLRREFGRLKPPLIARSAHVQEGKVQEGKIRSFAGVFLSLGGIRELVQERPDFDSLSESAAETASDAFFSVPPTGLTEAYRQIVESGLGFESTRYLRRTGITHFDPLNMNLIVMEEIPLTIFGMFLTRDCHDPLLIDIHYEIRGRDSNLFEHRGGIITYDRRTGSLTDQDIDETHRPILSRFGEVAASIDDLFGMQQVEIGSDGKNVYVFQSRTIQLTNPDLVPRMTVANPLPGRHHAHGYGFFTLPIIVIDALENTEMDYHSDEEYRRLDEASRGKDLGSKEYNAWYSYIEDRRKQFRAALLSMKEKFGEYALVIKDAQDVIWNGEPLFREKRYDFINELARSAKVMVMGRNQNAIRHEDWDHVETDGLTIIPSEDGKLMQCFAFDGQSYKEAPYAHLVSGDRVNFLSNVDGVFLWPAIR